MNHIELKLFLQKHQLSPNFTYGQNFLVDDTVLDDALAAAEVSNQDFILEIGPGIGNLTEMLLKNSHSVLSIEKDPKFLPLLKALKKQYINFRYEIADALEYNFSEYFKETGCEEYKVVANIPYYVTGKILQLLLNASFKPKSITVLMQKEVAQNAVAQPGSLNILAISLQLYGDAKIIRTVPAKSFYPAPKVESALLHIDLHKKPKYNIPDEKKFFRIIKACFSGKRKQIHNTLVNNLHLPKEVVIKVLEQIGVPPTARPQELSIEEWVRLVDKI